MPPSAINGDPKATFDPIFLSEKLVLYAKQLYIFVQKISTLLNYDRHSPFSKKVQFYENMTTQLFFGQSGPLHPKQQKYFFSGGVMWKLKAAAFQNTLELYHDQRIWGRNNYVNLDNAVLLPPKNALFSLLLDIKLFLTMKNLKHCFKWPTPLEWYDRDCLLSLVWGCQHILILALEFFQRSGHHMVPISCKAS